MDLFITLSILLNQFFHCQFPTCHKMKKLFLILIICGVVLPLYPQSSSSTIDFDDPDLRSINLQTYKGLPKFGSLDMHGLNQLDRNSPKRSKDREAIELMIDSDKRSYRGFFLLIERKFMSKFYNFLNTDQFAKPSQIERSRAFNYFAQEHIKELAHALLTKKAFEHYFLNPNDQSAGFGYYNWGGNQTTSERSLRMFQDFTEKYLAIFKNRTDELWPKDMGYGYVVVPVSIMNEYDINKGGYWVSYSGSLIGGQLSSNAHQSFSIKVTKHNIERKTASKTKSHITFQYTPEHEYEQKMNQSYNNNILVKMPEIPRSPDMRRRRKIYAVQKISFSYQGIDSNNNKYSILIGYSMDSPTIEFYNDDTLKTKIFETNLNQK